MTAAFTVVCTNCETVNRIAVDRPALRAKCARCGERLFRGEPHAADARAFRHHLQQTSIPVVTDFWAEWCGPCRAQAPVFEEAARQLEPKARFLKVDVEAEPGLASELGIRGIPALFVMKSGQIVHQQAGLANLAAIRKWIESSA